MWNNRISSTGKNYIIIRNLCIYKNIELVLNYPDAELYCQLLDIDGNNDWRLPTKNELRMWTRLDQWSYTISDYELEMSFWYANHPEQYNLSESKNVIPVRIYEKT